MGKVGDCLHVKDCGGAGSRGEDMRRYFLAAYLETLSMWTFPYTVSLP